MLVTIIADASHCHETKGAGYGFWIASNRGKMAGGGPMKQPAHNSTVAEMQAVVNALHTALKEGLVIYGDQVLLQTDCVAAIQGLNGQRELRQEQEIAARDSIKALTSRFSLRLEYRHVKGHTSRREARYVTNNRCDERARTGMQQARKQMRLNKEVA